MPTCDKTEKYGTCLTNTGANSTPGHDTRQLLALLPSTLTKMPPKLSTDHIAKKTSRSTKSPRRQATTALDVWFIGRQRIPLDTLCGQTDRPTYPAFIPKPVM